MVYRFGGVQYDLAARTHLMAVLNVTPDSFSDGGRYLRLDDAVRRGEELVEEGSDLIDVGGESTRPGSTSVPVEEELRRVVPVIERLAKRLRIPISIDTYKSDVARAALDAGALIVNDISGMTFDTGMAKLIGAYGATVILMHIKGTPRTMQENPQYEDVVAEVKQFLARQAQRATEAGIKQVIVDPGIGFGKLLAHNLELLRRLSELKDLGFPILVGPSRKSFLGTILNLPVDQRLEGTAAAVTACVLNGAQLVRVHDVKEMKRVVMVADALKESNL